MTELIRTNIGFTGTRKGMDDRQAHMLSTALADLQRTHKRVAFHHGGCHGADIQAHYIASSMGYWIECHPSNAEQEAQMLRIGGVDVMHPIMPPLERNRVIVAASSVLIAAPAQGREILRSGTWATVRYAREANVTRYMLMPGERTMLILCSDDDRR